MAVKYKIQAQGEEYKDAKGQTKRRVVDMGVVMDTKNGFMLKLNAIPVGWDGWAYLNPTEQYPQRSQGNERQDAARARNGYEQADRRPSTAYNRGGGNGFEDPDEDIPY